MLTLLTLLGPVALRVKAVIPVVPPVVASVSGGDDAATQLSSSSSVEARDSASAAACDSGAGVGRRSLTTCSLGRSYGSWNG